MASLFSPHPLALQTAYSEVKRQASEQASVLIGTPGSVGEREVSGRRFLYRQYYDAEGGKRAEYLGAVGNAATERRADVLREQIVNTQALIVQTRLLAREGYVRADSRTAAVVTAVANAGLFRGGAVLVGSHAYGVLLNELGVRSAAFRTQDVDLARDQPLRVEGVTYAKVLADSELQLTPVLGLDRKVPPTSFRTPGRDGLRVDLLVPATGREVHVRRVPELDAHATALPHLRYLLEDPIEGVMLGREGVIPVRVPRPERLAWHKMIVSQLRSSTSDKVAKDLHQASVLCAVLAENEPDALAEAFSAAPAKQRIRAAAARVVASIAETPQRRAIDLLRDVVI